MLFASIYFLSFGIGHIGINLRLTAPLRNAKLRRYLFIFLFAPPGAKSGLFCKKKGEDVVRRTTSPSRR